MTGIKAVDTIIILLLLIATGGTLGVFVFTAKLHEKPYMDDQVEKEKLLEDSKKVIFVTPYKFDKMTVNLKSKRSTRLRYLDVEMHFVPFDGDISEKMDLMKAEVKDAIIDITGHMRPDEINTVSGKIIYESRLKKEVNKIAKKKLIKKIFFSKFVVQ